MASLRRLQVSDLMDYHVFQVASRTECDHVGDEVGGPLDRSVEPAATLKLGDRWGAGRERLRGAVGGQAETRLLPLAGHPPARGLLSSGQRSRISLAIPTPTRSGPRGR
jgi:hypothetical protein